MEKPSGHGGLTRNSKAISIVVGLALVFIVAGTVLWMRQGGDEQAAPRGGKFKLAPAFELKDADGKSHRLADFKGKVVVLHFWAAWCAPCLEEIANWTKFAEGFQGEGVKFVAITLDDRWEDAHKILPSKGLPANVVSLIDLSKELPEKFGTYQYPETYLIGPDQTIVTKWVGPQPWDQPGLKNIIERVAAGK
ncbi:MAG TPA: TlpA disulfide reductase family protein [Bdellovibrionota bacterium]|nr:TlpA disulfide reductase family protein [Bdellovibrionota bacterium]